MPDAFRPIEDFIRGLDDDALYVAWPGGGRGRFDLPPPPHVDKEGQRALALLYPGLFSRGRPASSRWGMGWGGCRLVEA